MDCCRWCSVEGDQSRPGVAAVFFMNEMMGQQQNSSWCKSIVTRFYFLVYVDTGMLVYMAPCNATALLLNVYAKIFFLVSKAVMKQRLWSRSRPFCPETKTIQRLRVLPSTPTMNFRDNARWRCQNDPRRAMLFGFFRWNILNSYAEFFVYVSRSLSLCSRSQSRKKLWQPLMDSE